MYQGAFTNSRTLSKVSLVIFFNHLMLLFVCFRILVCLVHHSQKNRLQIMILLRLHLYHTHCLLNQRTVTILFFVLHLLHLKITKSVRLFFLIMLLSRSFLIAL